MANLAPIPLVQYNSLEQTIIGRLLHPNGDPIVDQQVALYTTHWFKEQLVSITETDSKGNFTFKIIKNYREKKPYDAILRVFTEIVPSEGEGYRVIDGIPTSINIESKVDLKDLMVELYEKKPDLPILKTPADPNKRPQKMSRDFSFRIFKAGFNEKIKQKLLKLKSLVSQVTTEDVQNLFGAKAPDLALTEENTIDMILNGIYPCKFFKTAEGDLKNIINWDAYDKSTSPDLPNVTITLNFKNQKLKIKSIEVHYLGEPVLISKPTDSNFTHFLYIYNSVAMTLGETISHLGFGHLMFDQLAAAFFRDIKKHPIKELLKPHFDGIAVIDHEGETLIFGKSGVLNISGLTEKGIDQILKKYLSSLDFTHFEPTQPIADNHRFAKASQLYWKIVDEVVNQFFKEHEKEISDSSHWYEIFNMSNTLVRDSLAFEEFETKETKGEWVDNLDYSPKGRVIYKEQLKAIRPITSSQSSPKPDDIERLKQFCKFSLYLVFNHWVVHSSQAKFLTNLKFGSMAPENRSKGPYGDTKPENAERQLAVAHILTDFTPEPLINDPYKAIYKPFIEKLLKHKQAFATLGYEITKLHYSVMI